MMYSVSLKRKLVLTITLLFFLLTVMPEGAIAAPSVTIGSPSDGATVSGTVTIKAATLQTVRVEFYVDNSVKATVTTPSGGYLWPEYEYQWDTTAYGNGSHTITTTAYDSGGTSASAVITVSVNNGGGGGGGGGGGSTPGTGPGPTPTPGAPSSTTGDIFGRVVNSAWQTIPGTAVRIDATVMPTNPGGEFRFTQVHPAIYTIYYDAPGYIGQTQVVQVVSGIETRMPTVILSPVPGTQIGRPGAQPPSKSLRRRRGRRRGRRLRVRARRRR